MNVDVSAFEIRLATPEDAPSFAAIDEATRDEAWTARGYGESLLSELNRGWVCHPRGKGDEVLAFCLFAVLGPEAELQVIAVRPDAQRQGIARRLLSNAFTTLRDVRVKQVFLEHRRSNAAAEGLYSDLGFTLSGQRRRYYSDGEDAVVRTLKLEA